jgi:mono/diheme cytochrome c family protein
MQVTQNTASRITLPVRTAAVMIAALFAGATASADDDRRAAVPLLPRYASECASCHIAYPPAMLPAASWNRLMQDLPRHFGTDASVDAATQRELSQWLSTHAGSYKRVREAPPEDRITRSAWFIREHREVAPATWQRPMIKSAANCAACHTEAEKGDFDEHRVRIPR